MSRESAEVFTEKMKAEIAMLADMSEEKDFSGYLELFLACLLQYMLEKVHKAQRELEKENDGTNTSVCGSASLHESAMHVPAGTCNNMPYIIYPEKEIGRRFKD